MYERNSVEIMLPQEIGDGHLNTLLSVFERLKNPEGKKKELRLNWRRVERILPAGFALLACLFDTAVEQRCHLKNLFVKKKWAALPVVKNLLNISQYKALPKPDIHHYFDDEMILEGGEFFLDILFMENVKRGCGKDLSEDLEFSCRLIVNELMQNTVDHSTAERYYLYAGKWEKEFHVGVLDMGITIPAKLGQKYTCINDVEYLKLALKPGIGTRRRRPGGVGLSHTFDSVKNHLGRLTIVSRGAQIRVYFKRRHTLKGSLKQSLSGTWCFARFPLEEKS